MRPERILSVVRKLEAFGHLPEEVGVRLLEQGQYLEFAPGELLVKQGAQSDFALVLIDGEADVLVETKHGSAHLASLAAPALVGEIGVLTMVSRTASIRARTRVQTVRVEGEALHRVGQENPRFLSTILAALGRRVETFNKAIGFYSHALAALREDGFDLTLLDDLRNPLPELVDFSRSFRELAEQIAMQRAHREAMASARAIQSAMLPGRSALDGCTEYVDVQARMDPAGEVGGDLFDFFPIDPHRLAVTIGDVCGKGVPAALFMSMTQTVLRYTLRHERELETALAAANALLAASNRERMFTTLFCAVLDLRTAEFICCSCGHHPPLVLHGGRAAEAPSSSNLPLGLKASARFKADRLTLAPGDRMLLFTDGFADATNVQGEKFGEARFQETVEGLIEAPPPELLGRLFQAAHDHAAGASQFDDLTAVMVTLLGRQSGNASA
ncbi:MAG: SpoIIE family protein phosphatase [Hyphomicrobiales bacterium]|nr:SpoIIE family protein phosphatase [Hyphomicrobiales bacterium]